MRNSQTHNSAARRPTSLGRLMLGFAALLALCAPTWAGIPETIQQTQPKIVKIYGAGGFQGMEAYQSGLLISPEGHVLTAFSYVLDSDTVTAVLADGRKFEAKVLGADPRLEVAVLKIEASGLPCFDLAKAPDAPAGTRVLALSNLFNVAMGDEAASVQRGTVAVRTRLDARRGVFETPYRGPVYVLDVTTNNPGAAGGALVNRQGDLVGLLGKELRNALNNTWLNYAIPIAELRSSVDAIRAGKFVARQESEGTKKPPRSFDLASLGLVLIPDVVERTPPYVDHVRAGSTAEKAGLRPDDLIVLLADKLVTSRKMLAGDLEYVDFEDRIKMTVLRDQQLIEFSLQSPREAPSTKEGPR